MKITPKFYIWLKCALIRAVRTIAQAMLASIGTAVVLSDIDWKYILSASAVAGLLSLLTSKIIIQLSNKKGFRWLSYLY